VDRLATAPADEPVEPAVAQAVWESVVEVCGWPPERYAASVARSYLAASRAPKKSWGGARLYAHWTVGRLRGGVAYAVELAKQRLDAAAVGVAGDPDERARVRQSGRWGPSGR
jgi:hypothetical protein